MCPLRRLQMNYDILWKSLEGFRRCMHIVMPWMSSVKGDVDWGLPFMNAKGNLCSLIKDTFCWTNLLNLSKWIGDCSGCYSGAKYGCLQSGEIRASSVVSLPNEDVVTLSLLLLKEIDHSLSPILGLALVALVLTHLGMIDWMAASLGASTGVGLAIFALF